MEVKENEFDGTEQCLKHIDNVLPQNNITKVTDHRLIYVYTYLAKSFLEIEKYIQNELQTMGLASIEDVEFSNEKLLNSFENELERLNQHDNSLDYFEDDFNLDLSSLNNILHRNSKFSFQLPQYDKENVKDDILLRISQRFNYNLINVLKQLKKIVEGSKNNDLTLLRSKNLELTNELKGQFLKKEILTKKIIESNKQIENLIYEKENLQKKLKNLDQIIKENELLKESIKQKNDEYCNLINKKEEISRNLMLEEECSINIHKNNVGFFKTYKNLPKNNSSFSEGLEKDLENSRKQVELTKIEKEDFAKNLIKLNNEKEEQENITNELLNQLQLQKETYEKEIEIASKKLNSQKKLIEEQTKERENELDDYSKEINQLNLDVKDKELEENNYKNEIDQFELQIKQTNEEKQQLEERYQQTLEKLKKANKENLELQSCLHENEKTNEKILCIEEDLKRRIDRLEKDYEDQLRLNESIIKNQKDKSISIAIKYLDCLLEEIEKIRCNPNKKNENVLSCNTFEKTEVFESDIFYENSKLKFTFQDAKILNEKQKILYKIVDDFVKEKINLNEELRKSINDNLNLENKICKLEENLNQLECDLNKTKLAEQILQKDVTEKHLQITRLKDQLDQNIRNGNENFKSLYDSLKKNLSTKEEEINQLNYQLSNTYLKLEKKENEMQEVLNEIEKLKIQKMNVEQDNCILMNNNKILKDERSKLSKELFELEKEMEGDKEIKEVVQIFKLSLENKSQEIISLSNELKKIHEKLKKVLSSNNQHTISLLDELIISYEKLLTEKENNFKTTSHLVYNQSENQINKLNSNKSFSFIDLTKKLDEQSENISSLKNLKKNNSFYSSSLESDLELIDEVNHNLEDNICNTLADIHNKSIDICKLSQNFKENKTCLLKKLIEKIPKIITCDQLNEQDIDDWKCNFIQSFNDDEISQFLANKIISVRPLYLNLKFDLIKNKKKNLNQGYMCQTENISTENVNLQRETDKYKQNIAKSMKLNENFNSAIKALSFTEWRRTHMHRKALIHQKKYLLSLLANKRSNFFSKKVKNSHQKIKKFREVVYFIIAVNRIMNTWKHFLKIDKNYVISSFPYNYTSLPSTIAFDNMYLASLRKDS